MADYKHLLRNLSDMVYEGLVKIGYSDAPVRIYYQEGALRQLLDLEQEAEIGPHLKAFKTFAKENLGELRITRNKDRFEFQVLSKGVRYIYENNSRRLFLRELIDAMNRPDCTFEEILKVFYKESDRILVQHADSGEFQYIVRFEDKEIDEFLYCFTFDEMGHYYHRLTEYDFLAL